MARLEQEHDEHLADISIQLLRLQVKRRIGTSIHCNVYISLFLVKASLQNKERLLGHIIQEREQVIYFFLQLFYSLEGGAIFVFHNTDLRQGA